MQKLNEVVKNPSGFDSLSNYCGETEFGDLHVVMTQNRDSDVLTRSNWECALELLGGENDETVIIHRFGHWACGWWEALCVKADSPQFDIALGITKRLENYPILDEDHFSQMEYDEQNEIWASCPLRERVELCQKHDISIFAARHDSMPYADNGEPVINLY